MRADLLAASLREEDVQTIEGFCDQLGLLLDGTELLARAIAVERSLAHAEKLAVIGEFAARVVHEIRNPVTAARSLAQQLEADLETGEDAEAARVILEELDRANGRSPTCSGWRDGTSSGSSRSSSASSSARR